MSFLDSDWTIAQLSDTLHVQRDGHSETLISREQNKTKQQHLHTFKLLHSNFECKRERRKRSQQKKTI